VAPPETPGCAGGEADVAAVQQGGAPDLALAIGYGVRRRPPSWWGGETTGFRCVGDGAYAGQRHRFQGFPRAVHAPFGNRRSRHSHDRRGPPSIVKRRSAHQSCRRSGSPPSRPRDRTWKRSTIGSSPDIVTPHRDDRDRRLRKRPKGKAILAMMKEQAWPDVA